MKVKSYVFKDRRYVYLTGCILAGLCALMWRAAPAAGSFLGAGGAGLWALMLICGAFCALALAALAVKLTHWRDYKATAFKKPALVRMAQVLYFAVWLCFIVTAVDRLGLKFAETAAAAVASETNPEGFIESMIYMVYNGRTMFRMGVGTTAAIALAGTVIAFILAILMVFLRIQTPARQDNDPVRFLKRVGRGFAGVYITVIRGTPMMVQALIIFYAVFGILSNTSMSITEINGVWNAFTAGLVTVSLNSTAYLAEVLRGGIESIDGGQTEAARSLGMTNWQAMRKVVFPQAVKNSIPAIGNEFIINIKDSSVLSVIGCFDLMFASTTVIGIYYRQLQVYCFAAIVYLLMTYLSSLLMKYISRRLDTPVKGVPSSN